jgi:quercetin dioxygenase-like cupin family protein
LDAEYSRIFDLIGGADARQDTSRHPSMHLTQTIDFIVLVRGRVRLLLDDDERVIFPGNVVVQRGTNHAWTCESEEPALLIAVLIDVEFAD